ncbi:MFS transporter [Enterococcus faecalis]
MQAPAIFRRQTTVTLLFTIAVFSEFIMQSMIMTAIPTIMKEFHLTLATVQWMSTGSTLFIGILIPLGSFLRQHFTERYLFLGSLLFFSLGNICCFVAPSFTFLVLGRCLEGIGIGIIEPLFQTMVTTTYSLKKRGTVMGLASILLSLSPIIGPFISSFVVLHFNWRSIFLITLPINGLLLLFAVFQMKRQREVKRPHQTTYDFTSLWLCLVGFGGLLVTLGVSTKIHLRYSGELGLLVISGALIFLFIRRQQKLAQPFLNLKVLSFKPFAKACWITTFSYLAVMGTDLLLTAYVQLILGKSPLVTSLLLLPGALIRCTLTPLVGILTDRKWGEKVILVGMVLLSVGTLSFVLADLHTSLVYLLVMNIVRIVGITCVTLPVLTLGLNALPEELVAHGTSLIYAARQIGTAVGIAVLTLSFKQSRQFFGQSDQLKLLAQLNAYHLAFLGATLFCVVGLGVAYRFYQHSVKIKLY